jgi:hypothetical protein
MIVPCGSGWRKYQINISSQTTMKHSFFDSDHVIYHHKNDRKTSNAVMARRDAHTCPLTDFHA